MLEEIRYRAARLRSSAGALPRTPDLDPARLVFVAGLHRSGTSILHRQLREHPDVSGFHGTGVPEDEGQHLQDVFPPARDFGGPGRFAFHPEARMTEADAARIGDADRDRLLRQWGARWDLSKRLLLEKSPPTLVRARFFQALFPGCAFVAIVRHPIAVGGATSKWSGTTRAELLSHWAFAHAAFLADRPHLGRTLLLRYEDYVAAPEATLARAQDFLGLAPRPASEPASDRSDRYFRDWEDGGADPLCDAVLGGASGVLARLGYRLSPPWTVPLPEAEEPPAVL